MRKTKQDKLNEFMYGVYNLTEGMDSMLAVLYSTLDFHLHIDYAHREAWKEAVGRWHGAKASIMSQLNELIVEEEKKCQRRRNNR